MGGHAAGRRPAFRAGSLTLISGSPTLSGVGDRHDRARRYVRVRTDVAAVPKLFDYAVPESWTDDVVVGTRVRVALHGRRVGGWVVEDNVTPPDGVEPLPLKSWSGWGPPPSVVELAEWAAWRWAGPISFFLGVASPPGSVRRLPAVRWVGSWGGVGGGGRGSGRGWRRAAGTGPPGRASDDMVARAVADGPSTLLRLPPTTDLIDLVLAVVHGPRDRGPARWRAGAGALGRVGRAPLCAPGAARLSATTDWAQARAGWPIVVGSRAAAWAPLPELAAALVLDAHDESYREESAPTYSAVDVVTERARRDGSPVPPDVPVPARGGERRTAPCRPSPSRPRGRAGPPSSAWTGAGPIRAAACSPRSSCAWPAPCSTTLKRSAERGPLVCFYDRTGRARLLACAHCGELAQCTHCGAAVAQDGTGLRCPRCRERAAPGLRRLRAAAHEDAPRRGVTRCARRWPPCWASRWARCPARPPVGTRRSGGEVIPATPVLIGTEAVLHRVRRAAAVVFLDIDLHLLAPRFSATDETLALLGPGLPAGRARGTRPGLGARAGADPGARPSRPAGGRAWGPVRGRRRSRSRCAGARRTPALLGPGSGHRALWPPATSTPSGAAGAGTGVTLSELPESGYLVQAPDHDALCDLLAAVPRPAGRGLRVAVDPARSECCDRGWTEPEPSGPPLEWPGCPA